MEQYSKQSNYILHDIAIIFARQLATRSRKPADLHNSDRVNCLRLIFFLPIKTTKVLCTKNSFIMR